MIPASPIWSLMDLSIWRKCWNGCLLNEAHSVRLSPGAWSKNSLAATWLSPETRDFHQPLHRTKRPCVAGRTVEDIVLPAGLPTSAPTEINRWIMYKRWHKHQRGHMHHSCADVLGWTRMRLLGCFSPVGVWDGRVQLPCQDLFLGSLPRSVCFGAGFLLCDGQSDKVAAPDRWTWACWFCHANTTKLDVSGWL